MDNIQMLEALENIDIMSTTRELLLENKITIKEKLDYLKSEFGLGPEEELEYIVKKNESLSQDGYVNIQKIIRINGLLNMLKVFLDLEILEKLKNRYRGITAEVSISLNLLDYNYINLKTLIYSNQELGISQTQLNNFKADYMDLIIERLHKAVVRDDSSLAYIEMSLSTRYGLDYVYDRLGDNLDKDMDFLIYSLIKYLDKLLEIRMTEYEFENDFKVFLSLYDLGHRYLMGEASQDQGQILMDYIDGLKKVSRNYLKNTRQGLSLEKDVDDFISYLDSIYDNDYRELLIRSNYPSVILKFDEEKDSLYGFEMVEFYL